MRLPRRFSRIDARLALMPLWVNTKEDRDLALPTTLPTMFTEEIGRKSTDRTDQGIEIGNQTV